MNTDTYPKEDYCDSDWCRAESHKSDNDYCSLPTDDGRMQDNADELAEKVVGHRIVSAEKKQIKGRWYGSEEALVLTLDDGTQVSLVDTDDCCAHTTLESFLLHPELVDHIITGVGTTAGFRTWHIYADMGDVLELEVGWSCGNPFYYGYGFSISVLPVQEAS